MYTHIHAHIGLGDRHPSNLMLNRFNGKVLHIDFGDCFEVAMHRDKFPEKVPFRLTRMLVNAMEVSGVEGKKICTWIQCIHMKIHTFIYVLIFTYYFYHIYTSMCMNTHLSTYIGNYRLTCEKVMSVLRENRDSLIAMLEAFVYDPLISWRLLYTDEDKKNSEVAKKRSSSEQGIFYLYMRLYLHGYVCFMYKQMLHFFVESVATSGSSTEHVRRYVYVHSFTYMNIWL